VWPTHSCPPENQTKKKIDISFQVWYSFGWESQLLETGFLAIFLVPASSPFSLHQLPADLPAPCVGVWGYRWLIVRIMLGAGLIKVSPNRDLLL
jgi:hypothetical protein